MEEDGLGSNWRGGCLFSGAVPQAARDARLRGEECCCVNPCFPSARLAVNGAGLMGLVRGLQLISVVHAAHWGAAVQNYQEVCRWQSGRVCVLREVRGGMVKYSRVQWVSAVSLPCCCEILGGVYSPYKTFQIYIFL